MIPKAHASHSDCWHVKYLTNTQHISLRKKNKKTKQTLRCLVKPVLTWMSHLNHHLLLLAFNGQDFSNKQMKCWPCSPHKLSRYCATWRLKKNRSCLWRTKNVWRQLKEDEVKKTEKQSFSVFLLTCLCLLLSSEATEDCLPRRVGQTTLMYVMLLFCSQECHSCSSLWLLFWGSDGFEKTAPGLRKICQILFSFKHFPFFFLLLCLLFRTVPVFLSERFQGTFW